MKRFDVYEKYKVTRTDGKEEPNAVYFVLRIDRPDNWWDGLCRWTLRHMARRLQADGDANKNRFGYELEQFANNGSFITAVDEELSK